MVLIFIPSWIVPPSNIIATVSSLSGRHSGYKRLDMWPTQEPTPTWQGRSDRRPDIAAIISVLNNFADSTVCASCLWRRLGSTVKAPDGRWWTFSRGSECKKASASGTVDKIEDRDLPDNALRILTFSFIMTSKLGARSLISGCWWMFKVPIGKS
jgi:hypothetical protein